MMTPKQIKVWRVLEVEAKKWAADLAKTLGCEVRVRCAAWNLPVLLVTGDASVFPPVWHVGYRVEKRYSRFNEEAPASLPAGAMGSR